LGELEREFPHQLGELTIELSHQLRGEFVEGRGLNEVDSGREKFVGEKVRPPPRVKLPS
jgi:hypothetical protein